MGGFCGIILWMDYEEGFCGRILRKGFQREIAEVD